MPSAGRRPVPLLILLFALAVAAGFTVRVADTSAIDCWMEVAPGIEPDPSLHWLKLPNGLRVVLKHQPHPPGATSLRMILFASFLYELPEGARPMG